MVWRTKQSWQHKEDASTSPEWLKLFHDGPLITPGAASSDQLHPKRPHDGQWSPLGSFWPVKEWQFHTSQRQFPGPCGDCCFFEAQLPGIGQRKSNFVVNVHNFKLSYFVAEYQNVLLFSSFFANFKERIFGSQQQFWAPCRKQLCRNPFIRSRSAIKEY